MSTLNTCRDETRRDETTKQQNNYATGQRWSAANHRMSAAGQQRPMFTGFHIRNANKRQQR